MYQLTLNVQTSWVVLALIAFLAGYYVQIINRLKDFPLDDPRRQSPKYYPMMTWLSWMAAILFITIFALIIRITLVLPLHLCVIFDHINIAIIIASFALSQAIHLGVFLRSYGEDMMRYFGGSHKMSLDNQRREAQAYEKAAENYEKAGDTLKAKEARRKAAENCEKRAKDEALKRRLREARIPGFYIHLTIYLVINGWVSFYAILYIVKDQFFWLIVSFIMSWGTWGVAIFLHRYLYRKAEKIKREPTP